MNLETLIKNNPSHYDHNNASLQFRCEEAGTVTSPKWDKLWFTVNGNGDGWFRVKDKARKAAGFGLSLVNVRVTSKNPVKFLDGQAWKVMVDQIDDLEVIEADVPMWLYVSSEVELNDVLVYIANNSYKWRA
jgi:hypothetical protein